MRKTRQWLAMLIISAFVLQACAGALPQEGTQPDAITAQSADSSTSLTSAADPAPNRARQNEAEASDEAEENAPAEAEADAAIAAGTGPLVTVSEATNCRSGPGIVYDKVALLASGQSAEVVATYPFAPYVVINNPNGFNTCWLWLQYADRTDFSGEDLPEAAAPPEPVAAATLPFEWNGYWTAWLQDNAYTFYVYIKGDHFTGELVDGTDHIIFDGYLDGSGRTVQGTYVWNGESSYFKLVAKGTSGDLFIGHWGPGIREFCGTRNPQPKPATCLGP